MSFSVYVQAVCVSAALTVSLLVPTSLCAQSPEGAVVTGAKRTRHRTVVELLPREPPSEYTDAELAETERRVSNLGVFDSVAVERREGEVAFDLREKWTLIPDISFATGKTLQDLSISLGASEYNVLGTASVLSLVVYREQRGFGFGAIFREHESRRHRWAYGGATGYGSSSLRFTDGNAWYANIADASLTATSTPLWGQHLRARASLMYQYERIDDVEGMVRPPDGSTIKGGLELLWDGYRFHDLVPRGFSAACGAGPGIFVPALQPRAYVECGFMAALPLSSSTVLTGRVESNWSNRGNANHSALLGSIDGVRGLDDSLYRNWAQAYTNVELRQSIRVFERLALQLVLFSDAAVFAELDARGNKKGAGTAFSGGAGARVIPTFLAQLLFRVDVARLVVPYQDWFVQLGVSQYF